eukprot:GHVH01008239.1.p1 GENE.GHVH01008239.1~~GHVH01008239.1.p1  ORF type:complete len:339 (-),score=42.71 GHVH01008239.1:22-1038(-)
MDGVEAPKKSKFRQRAHCNPLTDAYLEYPTSPDHVDWSLHFPSPLNKQDMDPLLATPFNTLDNPVKYSKEPVDNSLNGKIKFEGGAEWPLNQSGPQILDIGCGYGGMSLRLSEVMPNKCILGMEIREKVTDFVGYRIRAGRAGVMVPTAGEIRPDDFNQSDDHHYCNVSVIRQNAMKFLPHYIRKASVESLLFCFPDPNFKKCKWRRRIINPCLLSQYAYCMKEHGRLYSITDCYELHEWMIDSLNAHPMFDKIFISEKPTSAIPRHAYDPMTEKVLEEMPEHEKQRVEFTEPWNQDFGELLQDDPIPSLLTWSTEEGQKVLSNKMRSFISVFQKITT